MMPLQNGVFCANTALLGFLLRLHTILYAALAKSLASCLDTKYLFPRDLK